MGDSFWRDGRAGARGHCHVDGHDGTVMKPGYARHPVRDVAKRRARWKAKRNFVIPKDNPQSRFIRPRLMEALHLDLLWSCRRAGANAPQWPQ